MKGKKCYWKYDEWHDFYDTSCDKAHCFIEGNITENHYIYCPFCGHIIKEVTTE